MSDLVPVSPTADPYVRAALLAAEFVEGRRSDHTKDAYRRDLRLWLDFCQARDVNPLDAWPNDAMRWTSELAAGDPHTGRKPERATTRARRLGAVSAWYRWLIRHECAQRNPVANLLPEERPKRAPRRAPALDNAQATALLAAADADSLRAAAVVYLMVYTGIRSGEMVAADEADIIMDKGEMLLEVHGKGGAGRRVRLNPVVLARLEAWIASKPDRDLLPVPAAQAGAGQPRPLISTALGNRIDRKEIRRLLKRLARKAGLPAALVDRLSPHSTRATYATSSIAANLSLRAVQETMGHISPDTTAGYDQSEVGPDRDPAIRLLGFIKPPTPPADQPEENEA